MASSDATEKVNKKQQLKLYNYFRSTSSCRVRIALNLKGIDYEYKVVNLLKGEQLSPEYLEINPMGYVPALVDGDITIADSLAIIMYLEEKYPQRPLLPGDLAIKAVNFQVASIVSSGIQPLHNLSVLKYIGEKVSPDEKLPWVQTHIRKGFSAYRASNLVWPVSALEKLLSNHAGKYATGDEVYLADIFLAPQIDGAIKRFSVDMAEFPLLSRLNAAYKELSAFQDAMPERQPDTPACNDATENLNRKQQIKLYSYFKSTSSCRVRIALNLKGIDYDYEAVNLLKGEQHTPEYLKLNPMGYVPALVDGDITIADSFAIIMYLEEKYPQHPLLPDDLVTRAVNFQTYIGEKFGPDERLPWVQFHIRKGFTVWPVSALEKLLSDHAGKYATGDEVYLADIFLAPQIDAAIKRFSIDMTEFPLLSRLNAAYKELSAFQDAMPEKQPDTPIAVI
uniref:glutathione transferase n=1 Tax=Daucus carota subsp. sativus TaxID=79200 RepID=A0A164VGN6_DAUCS